MELNWSRDAASWPHHKASRFVSAAGLRWHVQEIGTGPLLLLIHGTAASTHSWRGLMPLLAENFRVLAIDLPGHGFTEMPASRRMSLPGMAADIAQLLHAIGFEPEVAVGHSAGAAILARMSLNGSIAPRVLVSLNGAFLPFGGMAGRLFSPLAKLLVLNPVVPRVFAWQASSAGSVDRLLRDTGSALDAEGVALYRRLVQSPPHVSAALRMMANWHLDPLVNDLPRLKAKLLLIAAENDRAVSPDVARKIQQIVQGSKMTRVRGAGHLAHEEKPEIVAELILQSTRDQV